MEIKASARAGIRPLRRRQGSRGQGHGDESRRLHEGNG